MVEIEELDDSGLEGKKAQFEKLKESKCCPPLITSSVLPAKYGTASKVLDCTRPGKNVNAASGSN
jgi:hypothetical protein